MAAAVFRYSMATKSENTGKEFKPEKEPLISIFTWGFTLFGTGAILYLLISAYSVTDLLIIGWITAISAYQLYIWFTTTYTIDDNVLKYKVGFSKGGIPISSIYKIELNAKPSLGIHYPLALKGINIFYNRWDVLYVSPKDRPLFVDELLKQNSSIEVEDAKAKTEVFNK
ncbi:MAG: PH domain-containing protein [Hymenobacteraceae bacterium]|nr:PH domain-containing protein [Hymenobacteraceae bacterium]